MDVFCQDLEWVSCLNAIACSFMENSLPLNWFLLIILIYAKWVFGDQEFDCCCIY